MNFEEAKAKVKKLMNLAQDDGAFDKEVENALRFARRLMLEHNVTEADLANSDGHVRAAEDEYLDVAGYTNGRSIVNWESYLVNAVVKLVGSIGAYIQNGVAPRRNEKGIVETWSTGQVKMARKVVFYGAAEDVKAALELWVEWSHVIAAAGRLKYGGALRGDGRAYCEGFAAALYAKTSSIVAEETSTALTVVHQNMLAKKQKAKEWLKTEKGISLGGSRRMGCSNNDPGAYAAGRADGSRATFSRTTVKKLS